MADKSAIAHIESGVRKLIEDHKRLRELCTEVVSERDTLKAENRSLQERVRTLDAELSRTRLAEGFAGDSSDRDKARARVNRLMREVDKCIALLQKPQTGATPTTQDAE